MQQRFWSFFFQQTIRQNRNVRFFSTSTAPIGSNPPNKESNLSRILKNLGLGVIGTGVIGTTSLSWACLYTDWIIENDAQLSPAHFPMHFLRFYRTLTAGMSIVVDYKWNLRNFEYGTDEYRKERSKIHKRSAIKLLRLCQKNRAGFVKAAQHVASMDAILPREFTETLSVMQDKAPITHFSEIVRSFYKEFGTSPDSLFKEFDENPIAAASLAQVHRARLHTGEEVAVKVQYPGIEEKFLGDIRSIDVVTRIVSWFFPAYKFQWLIPEFKKNIRQELDFIQEGKNSEQTKKNFQRTNRELNSYLKIPKVFWDYTTKHILTMEFVRGVKINHTKAIQNMGLDPKQVADLFIQMFSEQIFVHGFIHGDPHAGNVFVTKVKNRPQIIIIDHGIYRSVDDTFRLNYCNLWKALVLRNSKDIEYYARKLGAGEYFGLLAIVLSLRPSSNKWDVGLSKKHTKSDFKKLQNEIKSISDFTELLESVDDRLLLLLKTTDLVRSINRDLGAHVNRYLVMARYSLRGLYFSNESKLNIFHRIFLSWDLFKFEFQVKIYTIIASLMHWWNKEPQI